MDTYINFSDRVEESSPINISTFSTVGYLGYRWVTQIDPYWNVFFLGLILNLSSKIEQQRKILIVFTRTEYNQMRNLSQYSIRKLDGEITKKKY